MKLNADIVYEHLSRTLKVEMYGRPKQGLSLKRPKFYLNRERELHDNQLYIAQAGRLAASPVIGEGVVLVCTDSLPPSVYLYGKCVCLVVKSHIDLIELFDRLQNIYDLFEKWDETLQNILNTSADIKEMIDVGFQVLKNPIQVIDSKYHYLACSDIIYEKPELEGYRPDENGNIASWKVGYGLDQNNINPVLKDIVTVVNNNIAHYSCNLFYQDEYIGNLTVAFVFSQPQKGDEMLVRYLSGLIEKAIMKHAVLIGGKTHLLRRILEDSLEGNPIGSMQEDFLEEYQQTGKYVLLKVLMSEKTSETAPIAYYSSLFENTVPGSIALLYEDTIVVCIPLEHEYDLLTVVHERLNDLLEQIRCKVGSGNPFTDLRFIRQCYRQCCIAIEMGMILHPEKSFYLFKEYALHYAINHSAGEFLPEILIPDGLQRLLEHDRSAEGKASYIDTLEAFLDNNMNLARTSLVLYVHKSSLVSRLNRIRELLNMDLDNPDNRLYLTILLKYIKYNSII